MHAAFLYQTSERDAPVLQAIYMLYILRALERHPTIIPQSLSQVLSQSEKQVLIECLGSLPHIRLPTAYAACLRDLGIQPPEAAYLGGSSASSTAEIQQEVLGMAGAWATGSSSYFTTGGAGASAPDVLDVESELEAAGAREAEQAVIDLGRSTAIRDLLACMGVGGDEDSSTINPLLAAWREDVVMELPDGTQLLAPVTGSGLGRSNDQVKVDLDDTRDSWLARLLAGMNGSDGPVPSPRKPQSGRKPLSASKRKRVPKSLKDLTSTSEVGDHTDLLLIAQLHQVAGTQSRNHSLLVPLCKCSLYTCLDPQSPEDLQLKGLGMKHMLDVKLKEEDLRKANLEVRGYACAAHLH